MSPSVPFSLLASAPSSGPKKSLSQLIRLRDANRETLSRLFEEKKKIMERMKIMNDELLRLDDEIEVLEEHRDQQRQLRTTKFSPPPNSSLSSLLQVKSEVKSEPGASNSNATATTANPNANNIAHESSPSPSQMAPPMTMNPDEVLTEPTQTWDQCDDEQLTDPLTWTQVETSATATTDGPLHAYSKAASTTGPQHQQQEQRSAPSPDEEDAIADYYYDSGDDHANGPPVNNSSIIEKNNSYDDIRNASTKLPPLQFETVHGPKPTTFNQQQATGTIDNFLIPSRTRNNTSNQEQHTATSTPTSAASLCPYSRHDIYQTLRQSFRLQEFRENQLEIIQSTLSGKDNFVLMKTGGGKSLLYQLPAVLESPKVTVVVSPLLSLIQDQEEQMNGFARNSCVSFTSGMGVGQHNENWRRVRDVGGGIMMILVTPERVFKSGKLKSELQDLDEQNRLGRFVIDECHCACQVRIICGSAFTIL